MKHSGQHGHKCQQYCYCQHPEARAGGSLRMGTDVLLSLIPPAWGKALIIIVLPLSREEKPFALDGIAQRPLRPGSLRFGCSPHGWLMASSSS